MCQPDANWNPLVHWQMRIMAVGLERWREALSRWSDQKAAYGMLIGRRFRRPQSHYVTVIMHTRFEVDRAAIEVLRSVAGGRGSQIDSLADKRLLLSGQCNSSAGRHQRLSSVESGQFATSSHRIWIAGNRSNLLQICEIKRDRRLIKCCYFYYFIAPGLGEPFVSVPIDQTSGLLSLSFHFHFWVA